MLAFWNSIWTNVANYLDFHSFASFQMHIITHRNSCVYFVSVPSHILVYRRFDNETSKVNWTKWSERGRSFWDIDFGCFIKIEWISFGREFCHAHTHTINDENMDSMFVLYRKICVSLQVGLISIVLFLMNWIEKDTYSWGGSSFENIHRFKSNNTNPKLNCM